MLFVRKLAGPRNASRVVGKYINSQENHDAYIDVYKLLWSIGYFICRCEWCGVTAHPACHKIVAPECNFGILEPIYLPPHAVSIPRTEVPLETIIGVSSKNKTKETITREFSCRKCLWFFLDVKSFTLVEKDSSGV